MTAPLRQAHENKTKAHAQTDEHHGLTTAGDAEADVPLYAGAGGGGSGGGDGGGDARVSRDLSGPPCGRDRRDRGRAFPPCVF